MGCIVLIETDKNYAKTMCQENYAKKKNRPLIQYKSALLFWTPANGAWWFKTLSSWMLKALAHEFHGSVAVT